MTAPIEIRLTPSDIELFLHIGREAFKNIPANAALPGEKREMDQRQFTAVCNFKAAVTVLVKRGFLPAEAEVVLDHSNS